MKTIATLLSLLLTIQTYCFDTLNLKAGLQGIKPGEHGSTVYQFVNLPAKVGAFVLHISNFPYNLEEKHFQVVSSGIEILKTNWVNHSPIQTPSKDLLSHDNQDLFKRINAMKERLRDLDKEENKELQFKRELISLMDSESDIAGVRMLYQKKDQAFKQERLSIYKELEQLQNQLSTVKSSLIPTKTKSSKTLFLSIIKHELETDVLRFHYFIPNENKSPPELSPLVKKDSQLVKGRVIEANSRVPLIYALVEIYDDKELVKTLYTDEMGLFETELAVGKDYVFTIYQEGYKNRKIKNFQARPSRTINYRTYTLKEKDPVTLMEIASYALPVVSLLKHNW